LPLQALKIIGDVSSTDIMIDPRKVNSEVLVLLAEKQPDWADESQSSISAPPPRLDPTLKFSQEETARF